MEEEIDPSPEYIKAFNSGYLLANYEPDLATKLTLEKNDPNDHIRGFAAGKKQFEAEILKWQKSFSRGAAAKNDNELGRRKPGKER